MQPSQRFRYRAIEAPTRLRATEWSHKVLAAAPDGASFCVTEDRGRGRLIYLSVPYGLGINREAHPVVARLIAHLTRGLMPVEVEGDVEWLVSRSEKGWLVTLLNPAGQLKPQQGITPTDYRENRPVTITARVPITSAHGRLLPAEKLAVKDNVVRLEVLAGSVRVIEMR